MTHSSIAKETHWTHQKSSRDGAKIDRFIVHHAANTSVDQTLHLFDGARQVSANYALGNGRVVATVPEEERAWTSGSYEDDRRAVTVEVSNSKAADPWPVSDIEFDNLARLIADVATRYKFPIDDDHVLTHQELWTRFGRSYATACPGDLQRRKAELLELANRYAAPTTERDDEEMSKNVMFHTTDEKYAFRVAVANDVSGLWIEWVINSSTFNNQMAKVYETGSSTLVGTSMFNALRNAYAAVRPQTSLEVTVGEGTEDSK